MNFRAISYTIGQIFKMVSALILIPFFTSAVYGELTDPYILLAYIGTMTVLLSAGFMLTRSVPDDGAYYTKEGLVTVGISWVLISVIGALPLAVGSIGKEAYSALSFIDWLFESTSGFTTTGSTVLTGAQIEGMSRGLLMWRSLSQWIGGMGILLFVLAVLPSGSGASGLHLIQAETSGYSVGKLVSKTAINAKILYIIYTAMTGAVIGLLALSSFIEDGTGVFHAFILGFGTAGTGGFSAAAGSVGDFNVYVQIVVGVFMLLFGINFGMYFLLVTGRGAEAVKNGELRFYFILIAAVSILISLSLWLSGASAFGSFWAAAPYSAFTAVSIVTTTGYDITAASVYGDFAAWPAFTHILLLILMFTGGCAGSTSGGFKCSRVVVLVKSAYAKCRSTLSPNSVYTVKMDGKKLDDKAVSGVTNYLVLYLAVIIAGAVLVSLDPYVAGGGDPLMTSVSSVLSCISNVGAGLTRATGASGSYGAFHPATKLLFSTVMLIGRLEIYPLILLFMPKTYSRKY